jgi:Ca2+-binding RTX toxin-like protein
VIESGSGISVINFNLNTYASLSVFGDHAFTINGSNEADIIEDLTQGVTGINTINGNRGNDFILVDNGATITYVNGGDDNDVIVGGAGDQLSGGNGHDDLSALYGAAYLSGGAGNDLLVASSLVGSASDYITMLGGSGTDEFVLAGNNDMASSGFLNVKITDLASGDLINLTLLSGAHTYDEYGVKDVDGGPLEKSDLSGKASITGASIKIDLGDFALTNGDIDLDSTAKLLLSNTTVTRVSSAIVVNDSLNAASVTSNLDAVFGPLTEVYQQIT